MGEKEELPKGGVKEGLLACICLGNVKFKKEEIRGFHIYKRSTLKKLCDGLFSYHVYIISAAKDIFRGIKRASSKYAASSVTEESQ